MNRSRSSVAFAAGVLFALAARAEPAPAPAPAPFPPGTPPGWTVQGDRLVAGDVVAAYSRKLGGRLVAARNTIFDVPGGLRVQLDLVVAASAEDAATVEKAMIAERGEASVTRRGRLIVGALADAGGSAEAQAAIAAVASALACDAEQLAK